MDLVKELEAKRIIHFQLEQQRQLAVNEMLRLEGDIRTLELLIKEGGKDEPNRDKSKD